MTKLKLIVLFGLSVSHAWADSGLSLENSAWGNAGRVAGIPARSMYEIACQKSCSAWPDGSFRPWPWVLHSHGKTAFYQDRQKAAAALKVLIKAGRKDEIGVGMLAVDSGSFQRHYPKNSLDQLLEPGFNLMAAAKLFKNTAGTPHVLQVVDRKLGLYYVIRSAAMRHQVDERLVHAVIKQESGYNPRAVSKAGAKGLMQLIPDTARRFGVRNSFDPVDNVEGGVAYLKFLLRRYNGNVPLSVAAYNAGENAVDKYAGIPPYPETQGYVASIMASYKNRHHPIPPA